MNSIYLKASILFLMALILVACVESNYMNVDVETAKVPLIVITDLYHPYQDPGDNVELINAYAIPNLDLRAVILDIHAPYLKEKATGVGKGLWEDPFGPREPGYKVVYQLNHIFNRNVPVGVGPYEPMQYVEDKMGDIPNLQNQGVNILKKVLEQSNDKVVIASFGSSRVLAVANNRFPRLMREKIEMIHLSAGTSNNNQEYLEWNVALDTIAFVSIMESGLPITIYPCAAGTGQKIESERNLANAFMGDSNNTYYNLESLSFINEMDIKLKQYLYNVFSKENFSDYLSRLDNNFSGDSLVFNRSHHVWETAIWSGIANLKLIETKDNKCKLVQAKDINIDDIVFEEKFVRCNINIEQSGLFSYSYDEEGRFYIYERGDYNEYTRKMNIAIPDYYKSMIVK